MWRIDIRDWQNTLGARRSDVGNATDAESFVPYGFLRIANRPGYSPWGSAAKAAGNAVGPKLDGRRRNFWVDTSQGRLKTRVYNSARIGNKLILILVLHGDIPQPAPVYQYQFAQFTAHATDNLIAVGVLRPGYKDSLGESSSGEMGYAIGDNYTADVVDAIHNGIRQLKAKYSAGSVVLVRHSGGAAIVANVIGRHPDSASAALLVACGCDPVGFMKTWVIQHPVIPKNLPNRSLLPVELAAKVRPSVKVRMVVGSADDVVGIEPTERYAQALMRRGVDVKVTVVPGAGHNILFSQPVYDALGDLISVLGSSVRPHLRSAQHRN